MLNETVFESNIQVQAILQQQASLLDFSLFASDGLYRFHIDDDGNHLQSIRPESNWSKTWIRVHNYVCDDGLGQQVEIAVSELESIFPRELHVLMLRDRVFSSMQATHFFSFLVDT